MKLSASQSPVQSDTGQNYYMSGAGVLHHGCRVTKFAFFVSSPWSVQYLGVRVLSWEAARGSRRAVLDVRSRSVWVCVQGGGGGGVVAAVAAEGC